MRRFFISPEQIKRSEPRITGPDVHHLKSVLRLNPGDQIVVVDGQGREFQAQITSLAPDGVTISLVSQRTSNSESPLTLALAQGFLKDKKMDRLVRPLTELGVNRWMPFRAERSVSVPSPDRFQARRARWKKLTQEAVKQCGRSMPMDIVSASSLQDIFIISHEYDVKFVFHETAPSKSLAQYQSHSPASMLILVGPEGGFSPDEVALAEENGFEALGLGPRVLRAETAALSAVALMQFVYGDFS